MREEYKKLSIFSKLSILTERPLGARVLDAQLAEDTQRPLAQLALQRLTLSLTSVAERPLALQLPLQPLQRPLEE